MAIGFPDELFAVNTYSREEAYKLKEYVKKHNPDAEHICAFNGSSPTYYYRKDSIDRDGSPVMKWECSNYKPEERTIYTLKELEDKFLAKPEINNTYSIY